METDKNLQRKILKILADTYPKHGSHAWIKIKPLDLENKVIKNLLVMEDRGLISSGVIKRLNGCYQVKTSLLEITPYGLSFL